LRENRLTITVGGNAIKDVKITVYEKEKKKHKTALNHFKERRMQLHKNK